MHQEEDGQDHSFGDDCIPPWDMWSLSVPLLPQNLQLHGCTAPIPAHIPSILAGLAPWVQLTLFPSNMRTTSCCAYSWISVSHAWRDTSRDGLQ